MKAVFVLFDSLNRHALSCYNPDAPPTPNFDRLAARSVVFERHYVGSMPCMPARRDIQTGRLNFLHRGWGPLEPFDHSTAEILRDSGIYTHLITDHYHYFEDGGTGFHGRYSSWEFIRGQEKDKWRPALAPDPRRTRRASTRLNTISRRDINSKLPYYVNREHLEATGAFPARPVLRRRPTHSSRPSCARRLAAASRMLRSARALLCARALPARCAGRAGRHASSTGQATVAPTSMPALVDALRDNYYALVAACDHYLGTLLDAFDAHDLWRDTYLVLSTDHGLLLGEKEFLGKNRPAVLQRSRPHPAARRTSHGQRRRAATVHHADADGRPRAPRCSTSSAARRRRK